MCSTKKLGRIDLQIFIELWRFQYYNMTLARKCTAIITRYVSLWAFNKQWNLKPKRNWVLLSRTGL